MDKKKKALLMGIIGAGMALFFGYMALDKVTGRTEVIVAAHDIDGRSPIKESDIRVAKYSEEDKDQLPDVFTDRNTIIDQYTTQPIPAGVPIVKSMLADKRSGNEKGPIMPEGVRAVPVEQTGLMMPGVAKKDDVVDIAWTAKKDVVANNLSKVVLQQVKIYSTYQSDGKTFAVLMLKPMEAEQLNVFRSTGELSFYLCPVNAKTVMTNGADLNSALNWAGFRLLH